MSEITNNTENTEVNVNENTQQGGNYTEYLAAINKLKQTTVDKHDYEALVQERNALLDNLVNGQPSTEGNAHEEETPSLTELRKDLFKPDHELNDIEYVQRTLALRNALLSTTGQDCFVGSGHNVTPTNEDYEKAQRVADVLQQCVDDSNGNNTIFIANLQSRLNDQFIPQRRR